MAGLVFECLIAGGGEVIMFDSQLYNQMLYSSTDLRSFMNT